ncbi:MAG: tyrosine-protein phosphatase [Acidobacteriota bacterium]
MFKALSRWTLILGLLAGCSTEVAPETVNADVSQVAVRLDSASVMRTGSGKFKVQWVAASPSAEEVAVLVADRAGATANEAIEVGRAASSAGSVEVELPEAMAGTFRPYFQLVVPGQTLRVAERSVGFEGQPNFRDLGGYETADGGRVKWGQLFRSGEMSGLTAADAEQLAALGIAVVCDLRESREREEAPSPWPAEGGPEVLTGVDPESAAWDALARLETGEQARELMAEGYPRTVEDKAGAYQAMFERLTVGEQPLVVHCSAGKDRAGIASSLVLHALGVPRAVVLADYELTNEYSGRLRERGEEESDATAALLAALPAEVLEALLDADRTYLIAAWDYMESTYGSVDGYLEQKLGVDAAAKQRLRELYVEPGG